MYKVYIRCYTYNQAQYIEEAMNGFVMQETDFPFVVTIVDDASTDDEQQVIQDYFGKSFYTEEPSVAFQEQTEYGKVLFARHNTNKNCFFAIVLLKENHHRQKKKKLPYLSRWINGVPYVALCEGDDYWTDSRKLQKQVNYMDAHPDCTLCVHSSQWRTDDSLYPGGCQDSEPMDYSVEDLIRCGGLHFATASFLYRTELSRVWPEWRRKAGVGDFPLQILAGLQGNVHYMPDTMCVYRFRSEGSWSSGQRKSKQYLAFQKNKIEWMTLLDEATDNKYQKAIYDQLLRHYHSLYYHREIRLGDYVRAVHRSEKKEYGRLLKDIIRSLFFPLNAFLGHETKK